MSTCYKIIQKMKKNPHLQIISKINLSIGMKHHSQKVKTTFNNSNTQKNKYEEI